MGRIATALRVQGLQGPPLPQARSRPRRGLGVHPGASRDLLGTGRGQRKEAGHRRRGKGKCGHQ
eukprot:16438437-Heterocapsa_arctica.AAC.1